MDADGGLIRKGFDSNDFEIGFGAAESIDQEVQFSGYNLFGEICITGFLERELKPRLINQDPQLVDLIGWIDGVHDGASFQ